MVHWIFFYCNFLWLELCCFTGIGIINARVFIVLSLRATESLWIDLWYINNINCSLLVYYRLCFSYYIMIIWKFLIPVNCFQWDFEDPGWRVSLRDWPPPLAVENGNYSSLHSTSVVRGQNAWQVMWSILRNRILSVCITSGRGEGPHICLCLAPSGFRPACGRACG